MEVSETVFWILVAVSAAWMVFTVVVMTAVLKASKEAVAYFRRQNTKQYTEDMRASIKPSAWER